MNDRYDFYSQGFLFLFNYLFSFNLSSLCLRFIESVIFRVVRLDRVLALSERHRNDVDHHKHFPRFSLLCFFIRSFELKPCEIYYTWGISTLFFYFYSCEEIILAIMSFISTTDLSTFIIH